ncbi:mitochondrial carrier domain-containing protein [Pavlovales sp. CCMP2436]|nr:mitochondrial carrier domain-containing protein [Pavlovales sp. CCMP2436]
MDLRRASAGALAGALANGLLHPLDTVKTIRQTSPKDFSGTFKTLGRIWRTSGPRGLYGGFGTAMIGAMPSSFLFFGTYEFIKQKLHSLNPDCSVEERARIHVMAAAAGNAVSSLIFVPKEMVKQRLQRARVQGVATGVRKVVATIIKENGVKGLYAAYTATICRNIPTTALNWLIYEELRLRLSAGNESSVIRSRSMVCGAISGAISSIAMTPLDVVKTRLATGSYIASLGLRGGLLKLAREEGLAGLFAGAKARMVGAALFSAIGLSTYEACKKAFRCGDEATAAAAAAAGLVTAEEEAMVTPKLRARVRKRSA